MADVSTSVDFNTLGSPTASNEPETAGTRGAEMGEEVEGGSCGCVLSAQLPQPVIVVQMLSAISCDGTPIGSPNDERGLIYF